MRYLTQAEYIAAWLCGGGLLLALLAWRARWSEVLIWIGSGLVTAGVVLWFRRANRRAASKWTKDNEDA